MEDKEKIDYDKLAEAIKTAEGPSLGERTKEKISSIGSWVLDGDEGSIIWLFKKIAEWFGIFITAISDGISNAVSRMNDNNDE